MGKQNTSIEELSTTPATDDVADGDSFAAGDRLALAARRTLARHLRKLYKHLPGAASGEDPHDVHQARVASRRMRAVMEAAAPAFEDETLLDLRRRLRSLAAALGEVRDRDVMTMRLADDAAKLSGKQRAALSGVVDRVQLERADAHAKLVVELQRKRTRRLLQDLNTFLTRPLEEVEALYHGLPLLVRHLAGSAIWREYEAVRQYESVMPGAEGSTAQPVRPEAEQLHELRIACKHLRYTLELFEPALGKDAASQIELVTAMQEQLGSLHDADVAAAYFGAVPVDEEHASGNGHAAKTKAGGSPLAGYLEQRLAERGEILESVWPLWQELTADTTRRKLAKMIGAL